MVKICGFIKFGALNTWRSYVEGMFTHVLYSDNVKYLLTWYVAHEKEVLFVIILLFDK